MHLQFYRSRMEFIEHVAFALIRGYRRKTVTGDVTISYESRKVKQKHFYYTILTVVSSPFQFTLRT